MCINSYKGSWVFEFMTNYDLVVGEIKACVDMYFKGELEVGSLSEIDMSSFSEGSLAIEVLDVLREACVLSAKGRSVENFNDKLVELVSSL